MLVLSMQMQAELKIPEHRAAAGTLADWGPGNLQPGNSGISCPRVKAERMETLLYVASIRSSRFT